MQLSKCIPYIIRNSTWEADLYRWKTLFTYIKILLKHILKRFQIKAEYHWLTSPHNMRVLSLQSHRLNNITWVCGYHRIPQAAADIKNKFKKKKHRLTFWRKWWFIIKSLITTKNLFLLLFSVIYRFFSIIRNDNMSFTQQCLLPQLIQSK